VAYFQSGANLYLAQMTYTVAASAATIPIAVDKLT
jgi:hypothetical protein